MYQFIENEANHQPQNPGQDPIQAKRDKSKRIPMSVPQLKLEVPEIPGWHLYWAAESNLPRFFQGGYELVYDREIHLNQTGIGSQHSISGNMDMGTRVAIAAGVKENGDTEYLVLVKIEEEYFREDQGKIEALNRRILRAIFKERKPIDQGGQGNNPGDTQQRYVDQAQISVNGHLRPQDPLFQRRQKKSV